MKKFNDNDIKRVGLEILEAVHEYCLHHQLRYSLFYGTLLGAIRHKGYIPWDDDIDIAMPRQDYERFVASFDSKDYGVMSCETTPDYYLPFAKVYDKRTIKEEPYYFERGFEIGFNIDVFPCDEISSVAEFHASKMANRKWVRRHRFSLLKKKKPVSLKDLGKNILASFFNGKSNYYSRKIDAATRKAFHGKPFNLYGQFDIYLIGHDYVFPKETFDQLVPTEFEGHTFLATKLFDDVLTQSYGDYMTLPPKKEQVTHHSFKAFFK